MTVGSRVVFPEEVGLWDAEILQISVYRGMKGNLGLMRDCAALCRERAVPFVVHPVGFSLMREGMLKPLKEMAELTDLALILHDEKAPGGGRLEGPHRDTFIKALEQLRPLASVSFENAADTGDVRWFWDRFADSVTLDIGHVEAAGLDSVRFVKSLDAGTVGKIRFVHIHRNNGLHGGITDHWPLTPGCRELRALAELVKVNPDVSVILEVNDTDTIGEGLKLLRALREEILP